MIDINLIRTNPELVKENIRKKFGEKPGEYLYILNELGVGSRMNDDIGIHEEE